MAITGGNKKKKPVKRGYIAGRRSAEELLYEDLWKRSKKWQIRSYAFAGMVFFLVLIMFLYYVLAVWQRADMAFPVFQYLAGILLIMAALLNFMDRNRSLFMCLSCICYFTGFLIHTIHNMLQPEISVAFFVLSLFLLSPGIILLFRMAVRDEYVQIYRKLRPSFAAPDREPGVEKEKSESRGYARDDEEAEEGEESGEMERSSEEKKQKKKEKKRKKKEKKERKKNERRRKKEEPEKEGETSHRTWPVHRIYDDLTKGEELDEKKEENPDADASMEQEAELFQETSEGEASERESSEDARKEEVPVSEGFIGKVIRKEKRESKRQREVEEYVGTRIAEAKLCMISVENTSNQREFEKSLRRLKEIYKELLPYEDTVEANRANLFELGTPTKLMADLDRRESQLKAALDAKLNEIDTDYVSSKLIK